MTEAEWLGTLDVPTRFKYLRGLNAVRKHRLFACGCCRHLVPWMPGRLPLQALDRAERFADGELSNSTMDKWRQRVRRLVPSNLPHGDSLERRVCWVVGAVCLSRGYSGYQEVWKTLYYYASQFGPDFAASAPYLTAWLLQDVFGNPFRPVAFAPAWRTSTAVALARQMYASREFAAMPILADALQDAGCEAADVLDHCRGPGPHVRGCWVVDGVLGLT